MNRLQFECFRCSGHGCAYCARTGKLIRPDTEELRRYLRDTKQEVRPVPSVFNAFPVNASGVVE